MKIPWQALSTDALRGLIEEFVTRNGTDYGDAEASLEQKLSEIENQLKAGEIEIVFDSETGGSNIVSRL